MQLVCRKDVQWSQIGDKWPDEDDGVVPWGDLMRSELQRLQARVSAECNHVIADAAKQPLDLIRLVPCFWMAVMIRYAARCGIAEEMVETSVKQ